MAEPRRVPLLPTQILTSNEQVTSSQTKTNVSAEASGEKADGDQKKSFRLEINLSTSNEKCCPEYSYVNLLKEKHVRYSYLLSELFYGGMHRFASLLSKYFGFVEICSCSICIGQNSTCVSQFCAI